MPETLTIEMMTMLAVLGLTVYLFVSEIVRVDVAALLVLVLLGLLSALPGLDGIIDRRDLFNGFASNAVMSIIAVMILGAGLDRTGLMSRVAGFILRVGAGTERRIIPLSCSAVGFISSFMQNVGAAALFLPVMSRIASRTGLPLSRLLMPMGFCAILGGTTTMVGSSPLILLNDLIDNHNHRLPPDQRMSTYGMFDVTPVGIALIAAGIVYFILAGRAILPAGRHKGGSKGRSTASYFKRVYGLDAGMFEVGVPENSKLVGRPVNVAERAGKVRIIAARIDGDSRLAPIGPSLIESGAVLGVMAGAEAVKRFVKTYGLQLQPQLSVFAEALLPMRSGISEVVIPPDSELIGKTVRDFVMREAYGLSLLAIHRGGETTREGVRDIPMQAGDTLVCHSSWNALARLEHNRNFVVVTSEYPHEELRPNKVGPAILFFATAIALVLFSDLGLSVSLMVGAAGMILTRVLSMDEAYEAISWKTIFLLASLIPLGQAMENTHTAAWIANQILTRLNDVPAWVLQTSVALLTTLFTLVMSNVGATVLLVPLAVNIAIGAGADPGLFALTVAIAASNSFLIPTHQVNALIMGPGGYRTADFLRAGGVMTVLFLLVSLVMLNLIF